MSTESEDGKVAVRPVADAGDEYAAFKVEQRGIDLLRRVIATCDVVIENYTPRVLDQLGLDYDTLRIDRPVAGLLRDLRRRGMLEDTLVLFTTEFGRTPFAQSAADVVGAGRDHNQHGFSVWLAGAGLKHGVAYGSTDEIGWKTADGIVTWPDFHATVLHLLGIDHTRLTYRFNGADRRLTDVHGHVIPEILS